jgi:putative ABC transport system permease protein
VDGTVLAFTLGLSLLTGLVFGLAPALHLAHSEPVVALQESGRRSGGGRLGSRLVAGLTVAEVALALMLLIGAGLLVRSFVKLLQVDPGFAPRHATAALIQLPEWDYPDAARRQLFFDELMRRIRALPQAREAAYTSDLPFYSDWQSGFVVEGEAPVVPDNLPLLNAAVVSPEYFHTARIRLLSGRGLEAADAAGHPLVVVVSEAIVKRFFGGGNAIGKRPRQGPYDSKNPWLTIVGVVAEVKNEGLRRNGRGTIYFPLAQQPTASLWLFVRSETPLDQLLPLLRRETAAVDRNLPLDGVTTLDDALGSSLVEERFSMSMLGIFAALALVLAAVGLYGVIAYGVAQRSQEIGVRIALGARRADVLRLVIGRAMRLAGIGIAIGAAAALGIGRFLASLLFEVEPHDPWVFGIAALLVGAVALLSAGLPALRAARTDPTIAFHEG